MRRVVLSDLTPSEIELLIERNPVWDPVLVSRCEAIFDQVVQQGDRALRQFTREFDRVELAELAVPASQIENALERVDPLVLAALRGAAQNIDRFHRAQIRREKKIEVEPGVICWRESRPIDRVGLYVPGGSAILPSTVLMLGIPAGIAGCSRRVICTPPARDGEVAVEILAAARLLGIREVYRVGGAQAIAALAQGTETIPRVDKILGPGNRYVQVGKMIAAQRGRSIDMVAGPSEVLIVADGSGRAQWTAADLISQAEHGVDSQVGLISTNAAFCTQVLDEIESQIRDLPRRDVVQSALKNSFVAQADSLEAAFDFVNSYAPEHLILQIRQAPKWVSQVRSAGSVFLGPWSPEVAGDYASGTNHTLPTSGAARSASGVSLDSFLKQITFQQISRSGLVRLGPTLETLALTEGLEGHRRAVSIRLEQSFKGSENVSC